MNTYRTTAILVGGLYITGTVAGILSVVVTGPVLTDPLDLARVAANANPLIAGMLLVLAMGFALAMVPALMFPILKKQSEALAIGYVVFRGALEMVAYMAMVLNWAFLLIVSRQFVQAGAPAGSYFQALGALSTPANAWIGQIGTLVFTFGAVMFYWVLYRSKLVPRWISAWGLVGAIPYLVAAFLIMFGLTSDKDTLDTVLRMPIALQEMVLAVWLIAKGFNPAAIASLYIK